ncbi:hypothetical protein IWQ60_006337 [Tieghemiomyces parasiticus]|uniref:PRELI/MSF1 domain-containing protein n=1 Tax=Tieghemiomyces parasiticus TaxID=78921 RepID=A0A9W8A4J3_9FUNG|nr:hypothetical protein IWQ60_006337 [Tieghemiomyces parasiticus]
MVKFYQHTFDYDHPFPLVTLAFWLRYPNPFAAHVLASDVIDRYVDPDTGVLHTTRLILKRGNVPKWARTFMSNNEAYILEQSRVDPRDRTMVCTSKNISHKRVMVIEETQTFTPIDEDEVKSSGIVPAAVTADQRRFAARFGRSASSAALAATVHSADKLPALADSLGTGRTRVKLEVRFVSNLGWGLTSRIESFCHNRFADSSKRSRLGMAHVLEKLQEKRTKLLAITRPYAQPELAS